MVTEGMEVGNGGTISSTKLLIQVSNQIIIKITYLVTLWWKIYNLHCKKELWMCLQLPSHGKVGSSNLPLIYL